MNLSRQLLPSLRLRCAPHLSLMDNTGVLRLWCTRPPVGKPHEGRIPPESTTFPTGHRHVVRALAAIPLDLSLFPIIHFPSNLRIRRGSPLLRAPAERGSSSERNAGSLVRFLLPGWDFLAPSHRHTPMQRPPVPPRVRLDGPERFSPHRRIVCLLSGTEIPAPCAFSIPQPRSSK
jgi:hypothetical protein